MEVRRTRGKHVEDFAHREVSSLAVLIVGNSIVWRGVVAKVGMWPSYWPTEGFGWCCNKVLLTRVL